MPVTIQLTFSGPVTFAGNNPAAAFTLTSAYAGFQESDRGSLTPGKLADFVILSRDIFDPAEREHILKGILAADPRGELS